MVTEKLQLKYNYGMWCYLSNEVNNKCNTTIDENTTINATQQSMQYNITIHKTQQSIQRNNLINYLQIEIAVKLCIICFQTKGYKVL